MLLENQLESINCNLCGSNNTKVLFEGRDEWFHLPGTFPVCECQTCGLIYLNPRPTRQAINEYYPEEYQPYKLATADLSSPLKKAEQAYTLKKRINVVQKRFPKPGQVLDVGCATGNFLNALRQIGWQPRGVELNEQAAHYARQRLDLDVHTGTLEEAQFQADQFDLVIFWDVLEHVFNPTETLTEAARITRPKGRLLLTLPNPHSIDARLFGSYWAGWDIPRHLQIFSLSVIDQMLHQTGWHREEMFCMTGRHWFFNLSLAHWLEGKKVSGKISEIILKVTRSVPFRLFTLPYFIIVEKLKRGPIMVIFARKTGKN